MAAKFPENIKLMMVTHMEAKSPSGFTIIRINNKICKGSKWSEERQVRLNVYFLFQSIPNWCCPSYNMCVRACVCVSDCKSGVMDAHFPIRTLVHYVHILTIIILVLQHNLKEIKK